MQLSTAQRILYICIVACYVAGLVLLFCGVAPFGLLCLGVSTLVSLYILWRQHDKRKAEILAEEAEKEAQKDQKQN